MVGDKTQDYRRSNITYASVSVTASGNLIDYNIAENTSLFNKVQVARELIVRNTAPMFIKLNSDQNDPIEVFAREGVATSGIPISNLYITTVAGCVIRVFLVGYN
jgi:hypothetical protein